MKQQHNNITTPSSSASAVKLEALGFCGADDSVNPRLLALISHHYPLVEWGVLFRPDKEGLPRYASKEWVSRLSQILKSQGGKNPRLAAHLCGSYVNDLLSSCADASSAMAIDNFVEQLYEWGFRRVQVNATAVNGVDTNKLGDEITLQSLLRTISVHPKIEFIVQKNDETEPLWGALLKRHVGEEFPNNIVFLHDESKGTGREVTGGQWPNDPRFVATSRKTVGYAGGIEPSNVKSAAENAMLACEQSGGSQFWIDMESGVRTTLLHPDDGHSEEIFDLSKCYNCIDAICEAGFMDHPELR